MNLNWDNFRRRFNELKLKPRLSYESLHGEGGNTSESEEYRFSGRFESLTEGNILWIRSKKLTIPVELKGAKVYLLPNDPEGGLPEKINWNRRSALTDDARVYAGGMVVTKNNRRIFSSTKENPLLIIFFEGSDNTLTDRIIKSGRQKNLYWNFITPYSHIMGIFSQIMLAIHFYAIPAYRPAALIAFIAAFAPLFPFLPPGVLLFLLYKRLWWQASLCRIYKELASLPLLYNNNGTTDGTYADSDPQLPDGEVFSTEKYKKLPEHFYKQDYPFIIPESEKRHNDMWYVFGAKPQDGAMFSIPSDPHAVYGILPGKPEDLILRYIKKIYVFKIISWIIFAMGILINILFIRTLFFMTGVIAA